jgi:hypothetical protein
LFRLTRQISELKFPCASEFGQGVNFFDETTFPNDELTFFETLKHIILHSHENQAAAILPANT